MYLNDQKFPKNIHFMKFFIPQRFHNFFEKNKHYFMNKNFELYIQADFRF